ncbi:MAG: hypothetical protein AAF394_00085 [Planctomycetota bacterium]
MKSLTKKQRRNVFGAMLLAPILAEANSSGCIEFSGGSAVIQAASGEGENAQPGSVFIRAYNGGALNVANYDAPVYVDLDGCEGIDGKANIPLLRDHDKTRPVGTVTAERDGYAINANGKLAGQSEDRKEIEAMAADGFEWQSSIGAHPTAPTTKVRRGATATVNGQEVQGPCYIARKSRLREITLLTIGADANTQVAIAAELDDGNGSNPPINGGSQTSVAKIKAERARREAIEAAAVQMIETGGDCDAIEAAMNDALQDGNISAQQFELDLRRNHTYPSAPIRSGTGDQTPVVDQAAAVEASALLALGWSPSELEKEYSERILASMDSNQHLKRGVSLQDMFAFAARANGQDVSRHDIRAVFQATMGPPINAAASTFELSGVLSNIANKSIKRYFEKVFDLKPVGGEGGLQAWRVLGARGRVSDFKEQKSYSLTGDMTYQEVGPEGELKHATLGEEEYSNQAKTYGRIGGISRRDYKNDDLGAFNQMGRRLGRGAALKLAKVWWTAFLSNSSFFASGNNNYFAGADSKLSIDSLTTAETMFLKQTDPDGEPLGVMPSILLVAPEEAANAAVLMGSNDIAYGGTTKTPKRNPHAGKWRGYTSPYLSNTNYSGASALAWYLLAALEEMPVIETVFLDGKEMPTIESSNANFDTLGVQMRGYHDFGVALQEKRGGVKAKGEA